MTGVCARVKRVAALAGLLAIVLLFVGCNEGFRPRVAVGDRVPASENRLPATPEAWRDVCTMNTPDRLHTERIANLIQNGRPFMVVFGTPQHCTMCVDQLVRIATLKEKYQDRFAFVHVDGYMDNAIWVEWGVTGEPWTFIVDRTGVVSAVFPGPTDNAVMEAAIEKVL